MNTVTATIDISKPAGRKLIKELGTKRCVSLTFENDGTDDNWHNFEDVNNRALEKMSDFYGIDMRPLVAKFSKYEV